jgi:hypothetical protein
MKKIPLHYKNQIVGYVEDIIYDDNGEVKDAYFYLFENQYQKEVIDNIEKGVVASLNKNPDIENLENNILYNIELENDLLILRKQKP